jgi:putative membrane protein
MSFLPILHGANGYPTGWLHSSWTIDPLVALSAFLLTAVYIVYTGSFNQRRPHPELRPVRPQQRGAFLIGVVFYLIALGPPLDEWAGSFLLSAHMLQHMLLMFVVAPLWLYGVPGWVFEPLTRNRVTNRIGYRLTRPVVALLLTNAVIVFWHVPVVYSRALVSEPVHAMQHGFFLGAAMLAWWPVLGQVPEWPRLSEPMQCLYLFLYGLPGGLVGALITFAGVPLYAYYGNAPRIFGIDLAMDQELAGLMMWVGGTSIYLLWITRIFLRWAGREGEKEALPATPRRAATPETAR